MLGPLCIYSFQLSEVGVIMLPFCRWGQRGSETTCPSTKACHQGTGQFQNLNPCQIPKPAGVCFLLQHTASRSHVIRCKTCGCNSANQVANQDSVGVGVGHASALGQGPALHCAEGKGWWLRRALSALIPEGTVRIRGDTPEPSKSGCAV